jgi:hypothetical protein
VEETEEDDQDHCWLLLEPPPFSKTDAMWRRVEFLE